MCYKICTKLLMKKKIIIKTHLKSWSIFRDFFSALWCCLQGTDQQYVATLQWHRFTNFNTCSSEWGGVCFPPSTTGRVIGAVPVILCLVSGFHSTPSIESQEQQLHHYTPNKGGTKPFKYNHTIPRLHQKTTTTLWSIKNARLQVPYKVIQAQEFVNFVLPWNFVWRQQKIYRQESVLTNPIFYVYYFKNNMRSQPSHSLPSAGLNLRHRFQTAGLGLGSNRSCSLWSYAWSLDFRCFKIDNRGRGQVFFHNIVYNSQLSIWYWQFDIVHVWYYQGHNVYEEKTDEGKDPPSIAIFWMLWNPDTMHKITGTASTPLHTK